MKCKTSKKYLSKNQWSVSVSDNCAVSAPCRSLRSTFHSRRAICGSVTDYNKNIDIIAQFIRCREWVVGWSNLNQWNWRGKPVLIHKAGRARKKYSHIVFFRLRLDSRFVWFREILIIFDSAVAEQNTYFENERRLNKVFQIKNKTKFRCGGIFLWLFLSKNKNKCGRCYENGAKMEGSGTCRVSTLMPRWHVHGCKHPHLHTKDFEMLYSRDPKNVMKNKSLNTSNTMNVNTKKKFKMLMSWWYPEISRSFLCHFTSWKMRLKFVGATSKGLQNLKICKKNECFFYQTHCELPTPQGEIGCGQVGE